MAFDTYNNGTLAEKMRITFAGDIGINTTAPTQKLHVNGNVLSKAVSGDSGFITDPSTGNYGFMRYCRAGTSNWDAGIDAVTNNYYLYNFQAGAVAFTVNKSNNNFGISQNAPAYLLELGVNSAGKPATNTWQIVSDERIKENIQDADLNICYDNMKKLKLRHYRWKENYMPDWKHNDRNAIGFIAQEVEGVYKKAVVTHDKYTFSNNKPSNLYKEEKEDEEEELTLENLKTLDVDQLYKCNFGATQKLIEKVEALEKKIQDLEKFKEVVIKMMNIIS